MEHLSDSQHEQNAGGYLNLSLKDLDHFPSEIQEKIERLFDILSRIYSAPFLSKRLAFYGGTCLNFVHLERAPRLSLDLDFNFRDVGSGNWWDEREKVDNIMKKIFSDLYYEHDDIKIQTSYPLTRFEVWYKTASGGRNSVKVEIGYQRRLPILRNDMVLNWHSPFSDRSMDVLTPIREELCSNKVATLLFRYEYPGHFSGRDLFDAYTISGMDLDMELFMLSLVIDSLTRPERRLDRISTEILLEHARIEGNVEDLIFDDISLDEVSFEVSRFLRTLMDEVKTQWSPLIDDLFQRNIFDPNEHISKGILNERIREHPGIMRSIERLKKGSIQ